MSNSLSKNFFTYGFGNILYALVNTLLIPIYIKKIPINDYALLSIFLVSSQILLLVMSFGISNGILRIINEIKYKNEFKDILSTSSIFILFISSFIIIILYYQRTLFSKIIFNDIKYDIFILPLVLTGISRVFLALINGFQRALNHSRDYVFLNLVNIVTIALIGIYIVFNPNYTLFLLLSGYALSGLITLLIGVIMVRNYFTLKYNPKIIYYLLTYGIPLSLASLLSYLVNYGNRYYLIQLSSTKSVAIVDIAQRIAGILGLILTGAFITAFTPYYLNLYIKKNSIYFFNKIKEIITNISSIYLFLGTGVYLASDFAFHFFSMQEYFESIKYIPFLILSNYLNLMFMILAMGTNINKKTKIEFYITMIVFTISIPANYILINYFDIYGAVSTQLLINFLSIIFIQIYNRKNFNIQIEINKLFFFIIIFIVSCFLNVFLLKLEIINTNDWLRIIISIAIISFSILLNIKYIHKSYSSIMYLVFKK